MKTLTKLMYVALTSAALYGCGGGGGGGDGGPITDSYVFPAGKATLTFSAMSTATLAAPISGIDFSLKLPPGMVAGNGISGKIEDASVMPGASLSGTNLAFGTYSASNGKTRLSMATTSDKFRSGDFLRLTCTVAPNSAITLGSLKALNSPVQDMKSVGINSATKSTVILTGNIKVTIDAVR